MSDPTRTSQSTRHAAGPIGASARTPAAAVAPASRRRPLAALAHLLVAAMALAGLLLAAPPRPAFSLTVLANTAVALTSAWSALRAWTGRPASRPVLGTALLLIALTAAVHHLAPAGLAHTLTPSPARPLADQLLHTATPPAALATWLLLPRTRRPRRPYAHRPLSSP